MLCSRRERTLRTVRGVAAGVGEVRGLVMVILVSPVLALAVIGGPVMILLSKAATFSLSVKAYGQRCAPGATVT